MGTSEDVAAEKYFTPPEDKEAQEKIAFLVFVNSNYRCECGIEWRMPKPEDVAGTILKELTKLGYRKLSEKPSLLSDEGIYDADMSAVTAYIKEHSGKDSWDGSECEMSGRRAIAQTQWDIWNKAIYG